MPPHPDRAIKRNNNRRSSRRQTAVDTGHAAIARVANVRTNETPQSRIGSVRKPDRRHATHRRTIHPSQAGSRYGPAPPGIGCSGSPRLSPRRHSRRGCCSPNDPAATTWSERCLCSRERRAAQTGRRIDLLLATSRAAVADGATPLLREPRWALPTNSPQDDDARYTDSATALSVRFCSITTGRPIRRRRGGPDRQTAADGGAAGLHGPAGPSARTAGCLRCRPRAPAKSFSSS